MQYTNFIKSLEPKVEISEFFRHLVMEQNEVEMLTGFGVSLAQFAKEMHLDFISQKYTGQISFRHIASVESFNFINQFGLKPKDDTYLMDLGVGVYVFLSEWEDSYGEENVKTWLSENLANDVEDILIVVGQYEGDYHKCIFGDDHKGYVVLANSVPPTDIDNIVDINVNEFLCLN